MKLHILRWSALLILAVGCTGVLVLFVQAEQSVRHEQVWIKRVQGNVLGRLIDDLTRKAEAYMYQEAGLRDRWALRTGQVPVPGALASGEIDGVLVVDGNGRTLLAAGLPIRARGLRWCLATRQDTSGLHRCPVTRRTVIYTVVHSPGDGDPALIFFRELSSRLEREIEAVTEAPVRFTSLDEPPPSLPGYDYEAQVLTSGRGQPLVAMASYYHRSNAGWLQGVMATAAVLVVLLGILDLILERLSQKAELSTHLERKNRELEELTAQRESLLRVLCHDLGNYLGVIRGWGQLLSMYGPLNEPQRQAAQRIAEAVDLQEQIVGRVRQQRALSSGKLTAELKPVLLGEALARVERDFGLKLAERRLCLEVAGTVNGTQIAADPLSFNVSVLNNLISNAIKFSAPGGTIRLRVKLLGAGLVRLSVQDEGIGMPPAILAAIWDPAQKTTRQGVNGEVGTGFGMPLVKQFVESYGGRVSIESRDMHEFPDGHGTTVHLDLRTVAVAYPVPVPTAARARQEMAAQA